MLTIQFPTVHLSRRYHGFDLPVPTLVKQSDERIVEFCRRHALKPRLLFVPTKPDLERYRETLEDAGLTCRTVSAETEERTDALHWLQETKGVVLATSIWERGMTVRDVQVAVVESEHRLFSTRGLIQMAGRAGRKPDAPTGEVCFFYKERTFRQDLAIRKIKEANRR